MFKYPQLVALLENWISTSSIVQSQVKEETEGELQSAGMEGSSNMVDWMNKIDSFDFAQVPFWIRQKTTIR